MNLERDADGNPRYADDPSPDDVNGRQFVLLDQTDGVRCDQYVVIGLANDWPTVDKIVREHMARTYRAIPVDQRIPWLQEPDAVIAPYGDVMTAHFASTYIGKMRDEVERSVSDHVCITVYQMNARGGEHPDDDNL